MDWRDKAKRRPTPGRQPGARTPGMLQETEIAVHACRALRIWTGGSRICPCIDCVCAAPVVGRARIGAHHVHPLDHLAESGIA